jgi:hypothetical protein
LTSGTYGKTFINDSTPVSFYTSYFVAAETAEEGLKLIKQIEEKNIGGKLIIEGSEELEFTPHLPKGVYQTQGLAFYNRE